MTHPKPLTEILTEEHFMKTPHITKATSHQNYLRLSPLARVDFAAAARECGTPAANGRVLCGVTGHTTHKGHDSKDHS